MDSSRVLVMEAGNVKEFDRFGHLFLFTCLLSLKHINAFYKNVVRRIILHFTGVVINILPSLSFFEDHVDKNHLTINENNHMTIIILIWIIFIILIIIIWQPSSPSRQSRFCVLQDGKGCRPSWVRPALTWRSLFLYEVIKRINIS